ESPDGFAIPFHYYDSFMSSAMVTSQSCAAARLDCEAEGRSKQVCDQALGVCESAGLPAVLYDYADRVLALDDVLTLSALREAVLDGLRHHIRNTEVDPGFSSLLNARVTEVFGIAKVRLRSSTNAEDLPQFSGAGLYESVGAYGKGTDLASNEVRKVFASVWNWRAYEERSFFGIDHDTVRMGVAVSTAFTDERANGVLITQNISDPLVAGMYVNVQLGAVPVTNPVTGALPEVFSIIAAPEGVQVARRRYSSLSPDVPLLSHAEIVALYAAALKLQLRFATLYEQDPNGFALDVEFKFEGPQRKLFLKQARPYRLGGVD
ncbi:MAG: PEP/pyruvate-binding domain-containing protein, partial [Myxococcota bacterium]|nr:PEP/pyruvate-binding domain-containing protein [Myxococcota bacterium]